MMGEVSVARITLSVILGFMPRIQLATGSRGRSFSRNMTKQGKEFAEPWVLGTSPRMTLFGSPDLLSCRRESAQVNSQDDTPPRRARSDICALKASNTAWLADVASHGAPPVRRR